MKSEINFYQINGELVKSLAPLLLKILDEKKKALIFCKNQNLIKEIDSGLWSYGRSKFIPHVVISDPDFAMERQPILITNKEENSNNAEYLVFLDEPSKAFILSFKRVFYFFEERNFSCTFKPNNFYKKQDEKWIKV
jgi:DNA polymerase IIIc chi subunit